MMMNELLQFCKTEAQTRNIQAIIENGSVRAAARSLNLSTKTVAVSFDRVKLQAANRGYSPEYGLNNPIAEGFKLKGVSELKDADGNTKMVWYKTDQDLESRLESAQNALELLCEGLPKLPKIKPAKKCNSDLLSLYTITDFHIGMYSWLPESGDDWDVDIASDVLMNAITDMMEGSPDSEEAILLNLGDFLHWDGLDAKTPMSGHLLDADTRFGKLTELSLNLFITAIQMLLGKHKTVRVVMAEGNHDMVSSIWLQSALSIIFKKNKNVILDGTKFPYYGYLFGEIFLGFHHGHKKANKALPGFFSCEPRYRSMWGKATYSYIHTGHYHHREQDRKEDGGAVVERHPTLSASDAYSARGGYISKRGAQAITYHKTAGEISRVTVIPRANK